MLCYDVCYRLKSERFPQSFQNGSWFYIDDDKPPVCLTDVFCGERTRESRFDPLTGRYEPREMWTFMVPMDFQAQSWAAADSIPLSVQAMQQVTFQQLKSVNACKCPTETEMADALSRHLIGLMHGPTFAGADSQNNFVAIGCPMRLPPPHHGLGVHPRRGPRISLVSTSFPPSLMLPPSGLGLPISSSPLV